MSINYYEVFGVAQDASEKEILKAYRRKALTCHPDKNLDNPKAAQLFIELSEALEVLTDPSARAALDQVLKAKEAAKLRTQAFDTKRKKFKDDLEERERNAENEKQNDEQAAEQLAEKIKNLREEGSRILQEQQEILRKQLAEEKLKNESQITPKLKVKWASSKKDHQNGGYNENILSKLFSKYGHVTAVVLSRKKNGLAIIEFANFSQANLAFEFERGLNENPLTVISWLEGPKKETEPSVLKEERDTKEAIFDSQPTNNPDPLPSNDDFEALVLKRMREAQERKRMTQQIVDNDNEEEVNTANAVT